MKIVANKTLREYLILYSTVDSIYQGHGISGIIFTSYSDKNGYGCGIHHNVTTGNSFTWGDPN